MCIRDRPWTKLVMDVRDGYARGPLFYVPYIIISGYIIVSAILALRKGRKENDPEKKREFRYLLSLIHISKTL